MHARQFQKVYKSGSTYLIYFKKFCGVCMAESNCLEIKIRINMSNIESCSYTNRYYTYKNILIFEMFHVHANSPLDKICHAVRSDLNLRNIYSGKNYSNSNNNRERKKFTLNFFDQRVSMKHTLRADISRSDDLSISKIAPALFS